MATKLQVRHDSTENWLSVNPVLESGEIGYETTTNKMKLGDGLTAWKDLSYLKGEMYDDTAIKQEISEINTVLEVKANIADVYTKTEINELKYIDEDELTSKNYMSKEEALDEFNTKTEINELLDTYVPITRTINMKPLNANITLTASDVNALPDTTSIPTKTSDLTNDSNFLTSIPAEYVTEQELEQMFSGGIVTQEEFTTTLESYAHKTEIPTKVSELDNDKFYLTEETIPVKYVVDTQLAQTLSYYAKKTELPTDTSLMNGSAPTVSDIDGGTVTDVAGLITSLNAILAQLRTRGVIA